MSLYHIGELVAVSGRYMATASLGGYPAMPLPRDCEVAGPVDNIVRPAPSTNDQLQKGVESSHDRQGTLPTI
jgi:hypothetical protein